MNPILLLLAPAVLALPQFPPAIQDQVGTPCEPPCTLCHDGNPSGATATTDFIQTLRDAGFQSNAQSLRDALDVLAAEGTDTDADGVSDIDALVEGTDPNPGGTDFCATLTPTYGCLSSANRPARASGALLALLGLAGLAWGRRR